MKKVIGILTLITAAAVAVVLTFSGTASAHAPYASSTPAKGGVVATAPTTVTVIFAEDIQSTAGSYGLTVTDATNASATSGPATTDATDAKKLSAPLKSGLANGRYVVRWNNTSADDGDPLQGAFSFYIGTQPTSADLAADQQLEAIEANELATASAEAAPTETPAAIATPAAAGTPHPPSSATAAGGGALPATGDGGSSGSGWGLPALIAIGVIATGSVGLLVAGARMRNGR